MAKGSNVMSNRKFVSDMVGAEVVTGADVIVGSTVYGGDSMADARDRKGGTVMSNDRATSDMTNGYDIVGAVDIIGAMCGGGENEAAKRILASQKIDARIMSVLKLPYAQAYSAAMSAIDRGTFNTVAFDLCHAMCSDGGVASMVQSVAAADAQFGGLGILQRAMSRRIAERRALFG